MGAPQCDGLVTTTSFVYGYDRQYFVIDHRKRKVDAGNCSSERPRKIESELGIEKIDEH